MNHPAYLPAPCAASRKTGQNVGQARSGKRFRQCLLRALVAPALVVGLGHAALASDNQPSDIQSMAAYDMMNVPPVNDMPPAADQNTAEVQAGKGMASWYRIGKGHIAGGHACEASGLPVAAHRHLPFGSTVKVTALRSGRNVMVCIGDRGPYVGKRIIDLTPAAAAPLGMMGRGVAKVKLTLVSTPHHRHAHHRRRG
ncbi:septal ring lytic transglycosylase RlpA family protein [Formicincola oecophyllae]|nr:septal ring lytic transglycosylase RlpA family protein [Formicincola oecophyllae]